MTTKKAIKIWKKYLKKNQIFISGDWFINYQSGIHNIDKGIEDHYIENVYDIYFRNIFLTFMLKKGARIKIPKIKKRPDKGVFKDYVYYITKYQPYYSIFQKYINIKSNKEDQEIKQKMYSDVVSIP